MIDLRALLLPLKPAYAATVRLRAAAYRRGWLPAERLEVPVVSVGNLSFGGTGKTPTVIALARDLVRRGRRPAVLTRGYRRRGREPLVLIGPDHGHGVDLTGDEPSELAARLPGVPIVVDANRVRGGRQAISIGADVLVLDDGFQHLRIARDLDLVLLDAGDPFAGGELPPRGRLREPPAALARASAVLVTKLPEEHGGMLAAIAEEIEGIAPGLPVMAAGMLASRVHTGEGWQSTEALKGRQVLAFAGIGRPQGFQEVLEAAGAELVAGCFFDDHHRYTTKELSQLLAEAARLDAQPITTAKDAVKLPEDAGVWVLEIDIVPVEGTWNALWRLAPEIIG